MAPQTTHHIPFVNEIVSYKAKDRLKELKAANQDLNGNSVIAQENATITAEGRIMIKFFAEVERILETIFKIRDSVREVEKMHREILLDPKDDQNKKLILEELMANFQETAKNVRAELKECNHNNCLLGGSQICAVNNRLVLIFNLKQS
ncbi:hypothetical protein C0J52_07469 [Blattella germanica]|nr:hypothetical protein C0J52_07469 [Blattella germanica]